MFGGRPLAARAADALTLARFALAIALVPLAAASAWTALAILLTLAWLSDFLDGRLARTVPGETRLGRLDMAADTSVGAGLVAGLALGGHLPLWYGVVTILVLGGLFLAGNLAAAMLLQLAGFIPALYLMYLDRSFAWWFPITAAAAIGIIDWRRLVTVNIPAFMRGLFGGFEHR